MSGPLGLAIVGAGRIAQAHVQALGGSDLVRIVAIADTNGAAAAALAEPLGCPTFDTIDALLDRGDVEAVLLCTPPATHAPIAEAALRRDVHVLCEKPLCLDVGTAVELVTLAEERGLQLVMASKFRYATDVVRARSLVASGLFGELLLFENSFSGRVDMAHRWNAVPAISGGGVLVDNGTHSADLMRFFLGDLAEVRVEEGRRLDGLPVEETVTITARSTAGVLARADLSWSIGFGHEHFVRLHGAGGWLKIGWKQSSYKLATAREPVVFGDGYDKVQCLRALVEDFASAVRGTSPSRMTCADAVASVATIEAGYRALASGSWQRIAIPSRSQAEAPRPIRVHPTAIVEDGVTIGEGTAIWDNVHVRHDTVIGRDCIVGEKSHLSYGLKIGDRVKINAMVYTCFGLTIEDGVMISAGTTFTNDRLPRATTPDLSALRTSDPDEHTRTTIVREGATIGAGCTIGSDLTVGRFAMVGMGSVVTRSIPDFHLALGNPARSVGCVCRCGEVIARFEAGAGLHGVVRCEACGRAYDVDGDRLVVEVDPT